jgi:O-antigen ligase
MRIFVGVLTISAAIFSIPLLQELASNFTGRAEGLFTDDNGAAGYLGVSAFLAYYPFSGVVRFLKPVFLLLVLTGVFATKSISGAASYLAGTGAIFALYWRKLGSRNRMRLAVVGVVVASLLFAVFREAAQQHNYLDRLPDSETGRVSIWRAGLHTFANNPLGIGIGPAAFKEAVIVPEWSHRKELHSDYLSFLVERGVLGFLGLLLILGSIGRSLARCLRNTTSERELVWILGLVGMYVFTLVDAISHETLHNRQVWLVYALIVAQERISVRLKRESLAELPSRIELEDEDEEERQTSLEPA